MAFVGTEDIESATADGILHCIRSLLISKGIPNWTDHLVGFGADGASVNFGCRQGIYTKLKMDMPWLIGIHCLAHRLELACKNAFQGTYFNQEIDGFLSFYTSFYRGSGKRRRELDRLAELLDESVLTPTRVDGTRWVDHRRRALKALETNIPAVIAHLSEVGSDQRQDIKKADAARVRGWLKKVKSNEFLLHIGLYMDVLDELSHLSLQFQKDSISLPTAVEAIETSKEVLKDMAKGDGPKLRAVKVECRCGSYRGVALSDTYADAEERLKSSREPLIHDIVACLDERYQTDTILMAMCKLDPKHWPEDLTEYGNEEVLLLLEHFKEILKKNGCNVENVMAEWTRLKKVINRSYRGLKWEELWSQILRVWSEEFPNILHIIEIIQVMPMSTSKVERAFSLLNRVKTDWRINLNTATVEDLMMISLEGPEEEDAAAGCVESAVKKWFPQWEESKAAPYKTLWEKAAGQTSNFSNG
ncbi:zinc finger protein 862-like [Hypomesus transpacificus]|uniref:zinc finger protein 862-like n=1 Tax=Hypomesus transpacificus TaxID=137520 RepID=UPI001F08384F|nr:zinc finger protein 862-like [Hypomesus transpacificus]